MLTPNSHIFFVVFKAIHLPSVYNRRVRPQFSHFLSFSFRTFHCGSSIYLHMGESPAVHPCVTPCTDQTQHQRADGCMGVVGAGVNVFMISDGVFFFFLVNPCSASCPHARRPHLSVPIGSFNQRFCFCFLVLIIKTNCIFLEEERVCVFTVSVWLPGTVSLAVAASSQKPGSLALLSSTPAASECCRLGGRKETRSRSTKKCPG